MLPARANVCAKPPRCSPARSRSRPTTAPSPSSRPNAASRSPPSPNAAPVRSRPRSSTPLSPTSTVRSTASRATSRPGATPPSCCWFTRRRPNPTAAVSCRRVHSSCAGAVRNALAGPKAACRLSIQVAGEDRDRGLLRRRRMEHDPRRGRAARRSPLARVPTQDRTAKVARKQAMPARPNDPGTIAGNPAPRPQDGAGAVRAPHFRRRPPRSPAHLQRHARHPGPTSPVDVALETGTRATQRMPGFAGGH